MNEQTVTQPIDAGAATRADLIAAARALFSKRGFDGTSVRAITTYAGTNLGAITYHFGSKRGLYSAVLEAGLRPMAARVAAAAHSPGPARERMLGVVEAYFDHFLTHPDMPSLLLQEIAAGKEPPRIVLETITKVMEAIASIQIDGLADGTVRPGHPVLTALSVVSQPVYLTLVSPLLARAVGMDLTDPDQRRQAVDHVLAFVDAGLAPPMTPSP